MKKPKLLLLLTCCFALFSLPMQAAVPQAINVFQKNGTINSTKFEDFRKITFASGDLVVHTNDNSSTKTALTNVQKIVFGNYVAPPTTETHEILSQNATLVFVDNAKMVTVEATSSLKSVVLFDIMGKMVFKSSPSNQNQFSFSANSLTSGIYLVRIETENGGSCQKIVLK